MNKYILVSLFFLSGSSWATDEFFCSGDVYTAYIVVGSDADDPEKDAVANVTIFDNKIKSKAEYSYPEFINDEIKWVKSVENYSGNELRIQLKNKEGSVSSMSVNGKKGELTHMGKTYKLSCEWER